MARLLALASAVAAAAAFASSDRNSRGQSVLRAGGGEAVAVAAAAHATTDLAAGKKIVIFETSDLAKSYTDGNQRGTWFTGSSQDSPWVRGDLIDHNAQPDGKPKLPQLPSCDSLFANPSAVTDPRPAPGRTVDGDQCGIAAALVQNAWQLDPIWVSSLETDLTLPRRNAPLYSATRLLTATGETKRWGEWPNAKQGTLLTGDKSWDPARGEAYNRYTSVKVQNVDTPTPVANFDAWPKKGENGNARGHLIASAMAFRGAANYRQPEATFTYRNCVPSYQDWDAQTWGSAEVAAMSIEPKCWATDKLKPFFDVSVHYMAGPSKEVYGYIPTDAAMETWGETAPADRQVGWGDLAPFPREMWGLVVVTVKLAGTATVVRTATLGWKCAIVAASKAANLDDAHPCSLVTVSSLSTAVGFPLLPGVDDTLENNADNTRILPLATDCDATASAANCKKGLNSLPAVCKSGDATKALFANVAIKKVGDYFKVVN